MAGPLAGLTVIDQTQALAGPYCSMILGDLGANVIKIERPGMGDQSRTWGPPFLGQESTYYLAVNRNKRSLTLNFAQPAGQEVLHRLLAEADIFMTNLPKLSSLQKYQIDFETLQARNKGLIQAVIRSLATPIHMSATGLSYRHHPPQLGEQNEEILTEVGYSAMEIETLKAEGIV